MCCVVAVLTLVIVVSFLVCLRVVGCGRGCVGYRWGLRHLGSEWRCGFFEIGRCCDAVSLMDCVVAVLTLVIVVSFVVCLCVVGCLSSGRAGWRGKIVFGFVSGQRLCISGTGHEQRPVVVY